MKLCLVWRHFVQSNRLLPGLGRRAPRLTCRGLKSLDSFTSLRSATTHAKLLISNASPKGDGTSRVGVGSIRRDDYSEEADG